MSEGMMILSGKVVQDRRHGRMQGPIAVLLEDYPDTEPVIHWHGKKIPKWLWNGIKSFMTWSYGEFKSEAQIRLFYNEQSEKWRAVAFPQYIGTGMFSEEIKDHENNAGLLKFVAAADGWSEFGTVHHHCTAGAFQSGTDLKDEIDRPGVHITLGHITSATLDVHTRVVFRKIQYKAVFEEWVDGDLEKCDCTFPGLWASQCFPRPVITVPSYASRTWGGNVARLPAYNNGRPVGFGQNDATDDYATDWGAGYQRGLDNYRGYQAPMLQEIIDKAETMEAFEEIPAEELAEIIEDASQMLNSIRLTLDQRFRHKAAASVVKQVLVDDILLEEFYDLPL